jgi:hypothetical protein
MEALVLDASRGALVGGHAGGVSGGWAATAFIPRNDFAILQAHRAMTNAVTL